MQGAEGMTPRRGLTSRRVRMLAQRLLFPLDRLSYAAYTAMRRSKVRAEPLELDSRLKRILILSPHQDDELLGCGGFLVRHGRQRRIQVVYVADGGGAIGRAADARHALAQQRNQEAREVCRTLHLHEPTFLGFEDGKLSSDARLPEALSDLIARHEPDLIMTPFITDAHRDHMATSMALSHIDAALLQRRQICLYQVHSHIPDGLLNRYLGLSDQEQAAKEQALALYISQNMTRRLTLSKYLLFSKVAPQIGKRPQIAGVEHFVMLSARNFWSWPPFGTRSSSCDS